MIRIVVLLALLISIDARAGWLDKSHDIFFPRGTQAQFSGFQSFPVFWWNFIVISDGDFEQASKLCETLRTRKVEIGLARVECNQGLGDFTEVARDWSFDISIRKPKPTDSIIARHVRQTLAQASLPAERAMIDLLRLDPMGSWKELQKISTDNIPLKIPRVNGFFFDDATKRIVIPIQANFPPKQVAKTAQLVEEIKSVSPSMVWIGPHASSLQNETQVLDDVSKVSIAGALLTVLFGIWLYWIKRSRLLLTLPPVLIATVLAIGATVLYFGSIHGITLSFGTGIVGLALDFGLHAALTRDSRRVWRANFFGLLTTLAGLGILMMSSVPLLKQMMFFSAAGLVFGFLLLYVTFKIWPRALNVEPLSFVPRTNKRTAAIAVALVLSGLAGFATIQSSWDLRKLEFQDQKTAQVADWLRTTSQFRPPFFAIHFSEAQTWMEEENPSEWAKSQGIAFEGVSNYLPKSTEQVKNRETWRHEHCLSLMEILKDEERKFFWPFLTHVCELETQINNHRYLDHLKSDGQWLTLWIPKDTAQEELIRTKYPESISLKAIADIFPSTLKSELRWMAPIAAALAALLIFIHFGNVLLTAVALIPFVCGLGLISIMHWLFKMDFSFVSLIGTVMIFGFSIDYGIFVADAERSETKRGGGTWTAITFAAVTTVAGYLPLLVCKHPVLLHLGQALFYGTIGTYIGAFWGIPHFIARVKRA